MLRVASSGNGKPGTAFPKKGDCTILAARKARQLIYGEASVSNGSGIVSGPREVRWRSRSPPAEFDSEAENRGDCNDNHKKQPLHRVDSLERR